MKTTETPRCVVTEKLTDAQKVDAICARVINGEPLNKVVKEVFIDARRFDAALKADPSLRRLKDEALLLRNDMMAMEIVEIADTEPDPNKARNRIAARQWVASRMNPKSWGDRMELTMHHTISASDALAEAHARRAAMPIQDAEIVGPPTLPSGEHPGDEVDIFS